MTSYTEPLPTCRKPKGGESGKLKKDRPDNSPTEGHVEYLDRARATPFVKWAGGKRALIPAIMKVLPESFGDYYEPFLGGGALFFALDSRIRRAFLSDVNIELMLTWQMVRKRPEHLIAALSKHAERHSSAHYRQVRDDGHDEQDPVLLAARFIYLNKTCFNGLYRVNKKGRFNVPFGSHINPTICDSKNLRAASEVLAKADPKIGSFENIRPRAGDLVYCDPPYDGAFAGYTGAGFNAHDHRALRDACLSWRAAGAHVIISNGATDLVRSLYTDFTIYEVAARRNINSDGNGRGEVAELLIVD